MNKRNFIQILLLTGLLFIISACATTGTGDTEGQNVIRYVDVKDNQIRIEMSNSFNYTIYKPGDPFRVVVELPGVAPGVYQEKIVPNKKGVTEINPVTVTEPEFFTKLEILLQSPARLVPEVFDNMLVLHIEAEGAEFAEVEFPEVEEVAEEAVEEAPEIMAEEAVEEAPEIMEEEEVEEVATEVTPEPEYEEEFAELPVEPTPSEASSITDIRYERTEDAVKVIIEADGSIKPEVFPLDERLVLDFQAVEMKAAMPKEVAYPLKGIRWGEHKEKTRVVIDLMKKASYDVIAIGNSVEISLSTPDMIVPVAKGKAGPEKPEGVAPEEIPAPQEVAKKEIQIAEEEAQPIIEEGRYTGKKISLDFQDADIVPIFRLFADVSDYNVVVSPKVKGKITMKLINVPWDQALDLVLRTHNLGKQIEGNIIRIAPNSDLAKESEEKAKAKDAILKAKPLATRVFTINYAGVQRIEESIKQAKLLSPRGSMTIDERASVIVVNDIEDTFAKVRGLIAQLDQPDLQVRQVMIEARIVEATTTFSRELGVQWGATFNSTDGQVQIEGTQLTQGTGFTGNNFMVNLPAGVTRGSGGAIGLGYINAARTIALDLQLSALERKGEGKIVSNPKIITMNNTQAKIVQGRTIYVPVATSDKTDIKAIDALLELDVTPTIAPGGAVLLKVKITKDDPGDIVAGNVSINRNEAETSTLVNSGDTVVIGGIYKHRLIQSRDGIPWLHRIPILGWFFKKERTDTETTEILLFITPRVVEYEYSGKYK